MKKNESKKINPKSISFWNENSWPSPPSRKGGHLKSTCQKSSFLPKILFEKKHQTKNCRSFWCPYNFQCPQVSPLLLHLAITIYYANSSLLSSQSSKSDLCFSARAAFCAAKPAAAAAACRFTSKAAWQVHHQGIQAFVSGERQDTSLLQRWFPHFFYSFMTIILMYAAGTIPSVIRAWARSPLGWDAARRVLRWGGRSDPPGVAWTRAASTGLTCIILLHISFHH